MTRMYYKNLVTTAAGDKLADKVDDVSPYTTGRSISDIIEQIKPFVPNI